MHHEANPSAYGKKINHIYKNIDLQFKKGSWVVRCLLNIPSWNQVIYIYISCLHYPSSLTFNISPDPELPQTILTRPRTWLTKVQNVSNGCGATMSQLDCRVDISRSFQKKNTAHTNRIEKPGFLLGGLKKKWAQVWNWPNGRWSFTPPSPQEVSPPSQLRSLCNSCHRLLLSHARCPDKKFGQGFLGSLRMRLYYSKRIPIANLLWSPATRWCIYIYI